MPTPDQPPLRKVVAAAPDQASDQGRGNLNPATRAAHGVSSRDGYSSERPRHSW
jgi:hypothetical protein